jgi:hypothetical protein
MNPDILVLWLIAGLAFTAPLPLIDWLVRACVPSFRKQALHSMLFGLASGCLAMLLFATLDHLLDWHASPFLVSLGTAFCAGISLHWLGSGVASLLSGASFAAART